MDYLYAGFPLEDFRRCVLIPTLRGERSYALDVSKQFVVREQDPAHKVFQTLYDSGRHSKSITNDHPSYCSQCLYELAA